MSFTYLERQELNELSKKTYGKSSFWYNHIYKKGVKTENGVKYLLTKDELVTYIQESSKKASDFLTQAMNSGAEIKL